MGNTIFIFRKWSALLGAAALPWLVSCNDDCEPPDRQRPSLEVMSPKEGQAYKNGDTIRIEAFATDNERLHEYLWDIRDDTSGVVAPETITHVHEIMEQAISGIYVVNGVTTPTLWTVTVHADDEQNNFDEKKVNIVVSQ